MIKLNPLSVTKLIVSGVVGIGTGKIVGKIIKNNVNPETLIDKVTVSAAAWVIGAIATERTKNYTNDMIDDLAKNVTETVSRIKMQQKLDRVNRGQSTLEQEGLSSVKLRRNAEGRWEPIEEDDLQRKVNENLDNV